MFNKLAKTHLKGGPKRTLPNNPYHLFTTSKMHDDNGLNMETDERLLDNDFVSSMNDSASQSNIKEEESMFETLTRQIDNKIEMVRIKMSIPIKRFFN